MTFLAGGEALSMRRTIGTLLVAVAFLTIRWQPEAAGADDRSDLARYDAKVRPEDRLHWSFQPVQAPVPPVVKDRGWVLNPIDAFILARLEERGWAPAPPADPRAWFRRLKFDLLGLPPTPEEIDAFLSEHGVRPEGAITKAVDRFLASPHYGERWGRYWLDVVRFAETNGYERDAIKPNAWRYRDYVIRSFNDDKPYDRFLLEQIAGDELPDSSAETWIATGFHRLGPWDDEPADPKQDRFDQLDDVVRTTASTFLGLTIGCARCHDHKFEPISILDYYRMVAIFDPLERPTAGRTELDRPVGTPAELRAEAARDERIGQVGAWIEQLRQAYKAEFLDSGQSKLPPDVIAALRLGVAERDENQKALAERHAKALQAEISATLPRETRQAIEGLEAEIARLRRAQPDLPRGYFFVEPSKAPQETHLLLRGQAANPGPVVPPGLPTVLVAKQPDLNSPTERTTGRRLQLARWMARPGNPLTARVLVNRVWQFHFGEGLVRTPNDFGTYGNEPTHPELLDWLASEFVRQGWSIKKLHRVILTSNAYRMSSRSHDVYQAEGPENLLLWRFPYRRLDAEAIRDAMLAVSGQLRSQLYGPSMYPEVPVEALQSHADNEKIWKPFNEAESSRRTIYAMVRRSLVVPMLEVLDFCDTTQSTAQRNVTSTAPQALTLLNGAFANRQARHLADRLMREVGWVPEALVERAYRLALGRPPSETERAALTAYLLSEMDRAKADARPESEARANALGRACRVLFNLNEFLYID